VSPKLVLAATMTAVVMATAGGCDALPGGVPTQVPTQLPTELPTELPEGVPTQLPDGVPTQLPDGVPTQLPAVPTAVPGVPGAEPAVPTDGVAAPLPSVAPSVPVPSGSAEPGLVEDAADTVGGLPWWLWALLVLAGVGLVAAIVALRRAKAAELRWAALWHEFTGEARWLDERVVPAVQDRSLDPRTLATRWQDGSRRFDDLDRRVWASAGEQQKPARAADLTALSESLQRLQYALDTEVQLRTTGVEQPGLYDAAQTVADARDDLRRTVTERTR
jgi:hypothetical protein